MTRVSIISTHVLDTASGKPGKNIPVHLEKQDGSRAWRLLGSGRTDDDGRSGQLLADADELSPGVYRLTFDTTSYYDAQGVQGLYPVVQITFAVREGETRFHIPLLLSPNGYTTYRGS